MCSPDSHITLGSLSRIWRQRENGDCHILLDLQCPRHFSAPARGQPKSGTLQQASTEGALFSRSCFYCPGKPETNETTLLPPYPSCVLSKPPQKVHHPVSKGLQGVRGKFSPDAWDVTDKKGPSHVIQLIAHPDFTSQGLLSELIEPKHRQLRKQPRSL